MSLIVTLDRKSGSAGMPRPISYAVFCLKKKTRESQLSSSRGRNEPRSSQSTRFPLMARRYPMVPFFFKDPATTEIYTLSLHDALPISPLALSVFLHCVVALLLTLL